MFNKRSSIANALITVLFFVVLLSLNYAFKNSYYWLRWQGYDVATTFLCEYSCNTCFIKQPINTLSNILYLFFALQLFNFTRYDYLNYHTNKSNLLKANFQYSMFFCFAMSLLFIVSTVFHASMLQVFLRFDMLGVYTSLFIPFFFTIHKFLNLFYYNNKPLYSPLISISFLLVMLASIMFCSYYFWNLASYYIGSLLLLLIFLSTFYFNKYYVVSYSKTAILTSTLLGIFSLSCYQFDYLLCNELSYFQLHSIWHVGSAVALYFFYLFLRSEKCIVF